MLTQQQKHVFKKIRIKLFIPMEITIPPKDNDRILPVSILQYAIVYRYKLKLPWPVKIDLVERNWPIARCRAIERPYIWP